MVWSRNVRVLAVVLALAPYAACDSAPAQPAAAPQPVDTWVAHTDADGGLTVRLPVAPTVMPTQKVPTEAGDFDLHTATAEVPNRDIYMAVTWTPLPALLVEVGETERMLDDGVQGMVKSVNGKLSGPPEHILLDHHPGREIRMTASVDGKAINARARNYVVHDRLFQLLVAYGPSEPYDSEIDKMFASFALTPEFAARHSEVVKFDWKEFKPADGKFTAKFPVEAPRVSTEKQTVGDQQLDVTTVVASAQRSYAVFVVGHFDLPAAAKALKPEQLFELGRNGAASSTTSKLVGAAEPSPLGKLTGEKYKLESEGGLMTIDARSYIDGDRFYFVMALLPRNSKVDQTEVDTFFTSFTPSGK